jgi:selenocysteine-specific elongation factor
VVALTKRDLVDQDWLDLVQADVEDFLKGTTLAGAPIVPCSARTGAGLDDLKQQLQELLERERTRPNTGRPRLPIDRVFTVAGFGTVVTGTLIDGELRLGQELEVQPSGLKARVRGLQSHKKKLEVVPAGTRTAVNLGGIAVEDLRRGQVLTQPTALRPTKAVDAQLRLIADAQPIRHNTEVSFHTGAAETLAKVALLDRDELQPGEEAWVQLRLQDEVALMRGDLFVLRVPSPSMTVGGGRIVEPHARRHRRRQESVLHQLTVLARGTPDEILLEQLRLREPTDVEGLIKRAGLAVSEAHSALARLVQEQSAMVLDHGANVIDKRSYVVSTNGWQLLTARIEALLDSHHKGFPLRRGLPKEELRTRLGEDPRLFVRVLDMLKVQGVATEDGPFVRLVSHQVQFTAAQQEQVRQLVGVLREAGVAPPDRAEFEAALRISPELTDALLGQGVLVEVAAGLVYERSVLDGIVERIRHDITANGPRTVAQIRDLLDASRKYVLAIVGYTDEHKITRRVGDERVLY